MARPKNYVGKLVVYRITKYSHPRVGEIVIHKDGEVTVKDSKTKRLYKICTIKGGTFREMSKDDERHFSIKPKKKEG